MNRLYWLFFALLLIFGRFALLCALYLSDTPAGGPLVADANRFIWHTLYAEIGFVMTSAFILYLISFWAKGIVERRALKIASLVFAAIYLAASAADDEVMRWMGQKLSISFIDTYKNAFSDTGIVECVFCDGAAHFCLTVGIVLLFLVGLSIFSHKASWERANTRPFDRKSLYGTSLILTLAVAGCTSHLWYNPSNRRWARIKPVAYTLAENFMESVKTPEQPKRFREGIIALGGDPDKEYPFYKENQNEKGDLELFLKKPLSEKPDIILLTIETLRGWVSDMRVGSNCKRFPNLCALTQRGAYYPNTYSVGAPSIEGLLGLMVGIESFPTATLFNSFPNTEMRALPEILSDAGYYTEVLLGSDPRFANEERWYRKGFDYYEFNPACADDVCLSRRFAERYRERPKDKPLFYHWMSRSMHIPFELPEAMGPTPKDRSEAYLRAEAYMDSSLGVLFQAIAEDPRGKNTLVILTGDHSYPNSGQMQKAEHLGSISEGFSWISLVFAGPGIKPSLDPRPVSQGDVAPSILGYLDLNVSNHFMGADLLGGRDSLGKKPLPPVFSFRTGDMTMRRDSLTFILTPVENAEKAIVQRSYLEPTWDTTQPCEGFVSGEPISIPEEELQKATETMKAAYEAWEYIILKNRLMPHSPE